MLLKTDPKEFVPKEFLNKLVEHCKTEQMKKNILYLIEELSKELPLDDDDLKNISYDQNVLFKITEPFQIKATDAQATALWFFIIFICLLLFYFFLIFF